MLSCANAAETEAGRFHSQLLDFRLVTVVDGLNHPWSLAFLPEGDILVSERAGRLRLIRDGQLQLQPIAGLPDVAVAGEGGLMDLALHPDFAEQPWIYFSYASGDSNGMDIRVARALWRQDRLQQLEVLFKGIRPTSGRTHFGSRLLFDRQGFLFVTLGDRGGMESAQDLADPAGSILRLTADGNIPDDNPFVHRAGAKPEIYSYGHRNPQGLTLHPQTGDIWEHEHGPRGGDEINWIRPGLNYGWPVITYGVDYSGVKIGEGTAKAGMEQPLYYWDPSIAPSGMTFYTGDRLIPWRGNLFVGALRGQSLVRLVVEGHRIVSEERLLQGFGRRIRDVRNGPDGCLWLLVDANPGQLLRLEPLTPAAGASAD